LLIASDWRGLSGSFLTKDSESNGGPFMTFGQFWIYMITVVISPLIAVQVSEAINRRREGQSRRLWIFRTLMATRANRLSTEHVQALNMIDIDFHRSRYREGRFREVREAWRAYFTHLNKPAPEPWSEVFGNTGNELFIGLLFEMGKSLKYILTRTDISSVSYSPIAHGLLERDQTLLRKRLLEVLDGRRAIPIQAPNPNSSAAIQGEATPK
jgi:hypothetical protein